TVLQEQKPTRRLEHSMNLIEGLVHLVDAAQRERAHDAVEMAIRKGKQLAAEDVVVHLDTRPANAALSEPVHPRIRIDGGDLADVSRIASKVQPGAEADFQDVAVDAGQQLSAQVGDEQLVEDEVAEARKDDPRIAAHGLPHPKSGARTFARS